MLAVTSPAWTALPHIDNAGDSNSSTDMDGPVPIDSNTSLATRHSVTSF
jgi:hypothetical protein